MPTREQEQLVSEWRPVVTNHHDPRERTEEKPSLEVLKARRAALDEAIKIAEDPQSSQVKKAAEEQSMNTYPPRILLGGELDLEHNKGRRRAFVRGALFMAKYLDEHPEYIDGGGSITLTTYERVRDAWRRIGAEGDHRGVDWSYPYQQIAEALGIEAAVAQ